MKSVLMIAYFFPPEGSAGSYRPLRFVRHLSKTGWRASVVAADPYRYERYDPELLNLVPSETIVVRVRGRDPWQALQAWRECRFKETLSGASVQAADDIRETHNKPIRSLIRNTVRKAEACYYQPDHSKYWIRPAVKATQKLCRRERPDVIWATAGPVSAWVVAQQASQRMRIPYVLDLRDPHGLSYFDLETRQPEWVRRRTRRTMEQLYKAAQSVVFLFDSVAESYCRMFPGALDPSKIHVIPNGYEGAIEKFTMPNEPKLTVLYTGTLSSYRYDTFLQALAILEKVDPTKARAFRFRFVGEDMEDLARQAGKLGLSDIVETIGPTSNAEITRLQRQSHALLIFGRPPTTIGHELVAGAKLFSYLKSRRPILGILPADETKNILNGLGMSTVADADAPQDIVALLRRVFDAWTSENWPSLLPNLDACEVYSAERQTAALARALEGVPMEPPFIPGAREVPASLQARLGQ